MQIEGGLGVRRVAMAVAVAPHQLGMALHQWVTALAVALAADSLPASVVAVVMHHR
jgi:hypothetical protein